MVLDRLKHARENLQAQVFFIAEAITASLDHTNLVVQTFDKTKGYLVLGSAVRCDAVPVIRDHHGKLFVGSQTLPLQRIAPVLEEPSGSALRLIVPKLSERFLEHVSGIEPLVGFKQQPQAATSFGAQVFSVR